MTKPKIPTLNCTPGQLQISPTDEQIEAFYRYQLNEYQLSDAKIHYKNHIEENNLDIAEALEQDDFQGMVDQYNDQFDANIAENDLWRTVVEQYFQENM